jgi:hypothetical protein
MAWPKWNMEFPIYVTRRATNDTIGSWYVNIYVGIIMLYLGVINALLWGGIGIWKAIEVIL